MKTQNNTKQNGGKHIRFKVGQDNFRRINLGGVSVYHCYPKLSDWAGRQLPDDVNPRSHEEDCLVSPLAKSIEATLLESPSAFFLANRGSTIIAERVNFNPNSGIVDILISDDENQGLADGATTDAVIGKVQKDAAGERSFLELQEKEIPAHLKHARLHLEILTGLKERETIGRLVSGRNTSKQVKSWSLADFRNEFGWLQSILESKSSPFAGKIGYEENSGKEMNVLDILALLTLFHPEFDQREEGKSKAPTVAYSSKGRMDSRLRDPQLLSGYLSLSPVVLDILRLHDHVYAGFDKAYTNAFGVKAKLGKRHGIESRLESNPYYLPLTGKKSNYVIPAGLIFPLLASLRSLLVNRENKPSYWAENPFSFFDKYGAELVSGLIEQLDIFGGNPNTTGKKKPVYTSLHTTAKLIHLNPKQATVMTA